MRTTTPPDATAFDVSPREPRPTTPRTRAVAAEFGLTEPRDACASRRRPSIALDAPSAGELLLIGGASGAGKSSLLRAIVARARREGRVAIVDLRRLPLPATTPTLDLFGDDEPVGDVLRRLARVGLAEVWTWLRPPRQLSEGQRWRLRVALALRDAERRADRPTLIVCDEFAAVLDRVTASIVAQTLRRAVTNSRAPLSAIVATSHDDLEVALRPDAIATCDFGKVSVTFATRDARDSSGSAHDARREDRSTR